MAGGRWSQEYVTLPPWPDSEGAVAAGHGAGAGVAAAAATAAAAIATGIICVPLTGNNGCVCPLLPTWTADRP